LAWRSNAGDRLYLTGVLGWRVRVLNGDGTSALIAGTASPGMRGESGAVHDKSGDGRSGAGKESGWHVELGGASGGARKRGGAGGHGNGADLAGVGGRAGGNRHAPAADEARASIGGQRAEVLYAGAVPG
jgi:hypothetical protein